MRTARRIRLPMAIVVAAIVVTSGAAQTPPKPTAVGVVPAVRKQITRSNEYVGRIHAIERVNITARVAAFLDRRFFTEGAEVKKDDLLYRLEQGLFLADVKAKEATIAQLKAQLQNAQIVLGRAKALLNSPAGQQASVDTATANAQALDAQVLGAEAQLQQSRINLGYTDVRAPIDGKIGRTMVTAGNFVSPSSGVLTTIVSQDPMHVVFSVSSRAALALRHRSAAKPVVIRIRLADGRMYDQTGHVDFFDNTVAGNTDTVTLRGDVRNPANGSASGNAIRELTDGEFVTVIVEDAEPVEAVTIPRVAVLTDQQGDYLYVIDGGNKVQQRRVHLGPSTAGTVAVTGGLNDGEQVVVEGIQRIRPGQLVSPGAPASAEGVPGSPTPG